MKNLIISLFFLCSCSPAITNQNIIDSANISSDRISEIYFQNIGAVLSNELLMAMNKYDCEYINQYIDDVNKLFCYVGGFNLIIGKYEDMNFNSWLSIIYELSGNVVDKWNIVFHRQPPGSIVGLRELIRRYIDNGNITLIEVNLSCENTQLMSNISCEY